MTGVKKPAPAAMLSNGRGWFRTSDLSRVKRRSQEGQKLHQQAVYAVLRAATDVRHGICVGLRTITGIRQRECDSAPSIMRTGARSGRRGTQVTRASAAGESAASQPGWAEP